MVRRLWAGGGGATALSGAFAAAAAAAAECVAVEMAVRSAAVASTCWADAGRRSLQNGTWLPYWTNPLEFGAPYLVGDDVQDVTAILPPSVARQRRTSCDVAGLSRRALATADVAHCD